MLGRKSGFALPSSVGPPNKAHSLSAEEHWLIVLLDFDGSGFLL